MPANGDGKIVLTYSALSSFRACPRRYQWRYIRQIDTINKPDALTLGSAVHSLLEGFYRKEPVPLPSNLAEKSQAVLDGIADNYCFLFAGDLDDFEVLGVELGIEGPIMNPDTGKPSRRFWFAGKADGLLRLRREVSGFKPGAVLLLEHKTSSRADEAFWTRMELDNQLPFYAAYLRKDHGIAIDGILLNVIEKPNGRIRPRKNEPQADYLQRLRLAMADPERYKRRFFALDEKAIKVSLHDLWRTQHLIRESYKKDSFPMTPGACFTYGSRCPYFELCTSETPETVIDESGLYEHRRAHPELVSASVGIFAEAAAEPF
jgi:hypothetical protein